MLLALTIISTIAAVSSALSALGLLPQRRRAGPQTVVIVVNIAAVMTAAEPQPERLSESGQRRKSDGDPAYISGAGNN